MRYYISKHGRSVTGVIVDNSELCRRERKFLLAKAEGKIRLINIQGSGPDCFSEKFPVNSHIPLRKMDGYTWWLYEGNKYNQPFFGGIIINLVCLSVFIFFFWMYRKGRSGTRYTP